MSYGAAPMGSDRNGVFYDGWVYLKMMFASDMPGLSGGWITHR